MMLQSSLSLGLDGALFDEMSALERQQLRARYENAAPFKHLVLDGLFSPAALRRVEAEFDRAQTVAWREINTGLQRKRGSVPDTTLPSHVQEYFNAINAGPFLRFLNDVTGISDLIPDPALFGGGMHEVGEDGAFEVHVDFQRHPRTQLNNRLTVITYLNEGWDAADGGHLELWQTKPAQCRATVTPLFGRTVIMEQSWAAAHGHPQPVRKGRKRRSVTAYFYTNGLMAAGVGNGLSTTYVARRGHSAQQRAELMLRLVLPPIVLSGLRSCKDAAQTALARGR
jgi:2OG-Fe(II) oxygenase superfamily